MIKINFKSRSKSTQIYIKQFSYNLLIRLGSIIISLIYVPLVIGYLSSERYGVWIALSSIINWMRLFDVGIGNGLRNKLTEAIALDQKEEGKILLSTAYFVMGGIFFVALIVALFVIPYLNWNIILNTNEFTITELKTLATIVVSFIVIGFVVQIVTTIPMSLGKSSIPGFLQLVISLLSLILIYLATCYAPKEDIILISFILTGVPILVYLIYSFYLFQLKYPELRPSIQHIRFAGSGDLFRLSSQFFIVQITAIILFSSIPFVVTQFYGPIAVTQYAVASSIFNLPILLINQVTAPLAPLVTQAYAKQEISWISNMLNKMKKISIAVVLLTIVMIIMSPWIYHLWIGNKVLIPRSLSIAVGLYAIINVLVNPYSIFLNALGKIQILVNLAPLGIFIFIGGCFLFDFLFHEVYAISMALSFSSLVGLVIIPPVIRKTLNTYGSI